MTAPAMIYARKFDGSLHRSWKADLVSIDGNALVFVGVFEHEVSHPDLGLIRRGTISYEYYWLDRWYNIFRFHEPDGALRNFYCNVSMPAVFDAATCALDYVDLDLDLLVRPDGSIKILDLPEFEENAARFGYGPEIMAQVEESQAELSRMIVGRSFPFDFGRE